LGAHRAARAPGGDQAPATASDRGRGHELGRSHRPRVEACSGPGRAALVRGRPRRTPATGRDRRCYPPIDMQLSHRVALHYDVDRSSDDWTLPDEDFIVPERRAHDVATERGRDLLDAWGKRTRRNLMVCRNIGVRWDEEHPSVGFDPDLCVIEP